MPKKRDRRGKTTTHVVVLINLNNLKDQDFKGKSWDNREDKETTLKANETTLPEKKER